VEIVHVTPENAREHRFFCIKNVKESGFYAKEKWLKDRIKEGLTLKVIYADDGKQAGFIEYVPAEYAWRPVSALGWFFIHCIMVYPNKYRSTGAASLLIEEAINEARAHGKSGVCAMTSRGPWMATKKVFQKNGFEQFDKKGRFELMGIKLKDVAANPKLIDWESKLNNYNGWNLLYADQCPWHDKGVKAILKSADERGIDLNVEKIETAEDARNMPSGFGVFALVKDGKLLEDHYLSKRRFETIVADEMNYPADPKGSLGDKQRGINRNNFFRPEGR
jgi:GNAT superfamily N-acetyltransferase